MFPHKLPYAIILKKTNQDKYYNGNNIFFARFVSLQIFVTIRVNENFFVQMTSCTVCYDAFYLLFPINSQYQKTWVVDSPDYRTGLRDNNHGLRESEYSRKE